MTRATGHAQHDAVRVAVRRFVRDHDLTPADAARALCVHPSSIARWCSASDATRPPGRPAWRASLDACCCVVRTVFECVGRVTIRALKGLFPDASRSWLDDVLANCRGLLAKRRRDRLATLTWTVPGTVWAMDHTALDGRDGPTALCVCDLASRKMLCASVVAAESAECTRAVLAELFDQHGAPLVLKSDNGSGFRSDLVRTMLHAHRVLPLFSPPCTPGYNGACESNLGTCKDIAEDLRALYEPDADLGSFLARAIEILDQQPIDRRAGAPTRAAVWASRPRCTAELRERLLQSYRRHERRHRNVEGIASHLALAHHGQASLDRRAIRDALCDENLLIIQKP